jgi:hypothetical protein
MLGIVPYKVQFPIIFKSYDSPNRNFNWFFYLVGASANDYPEKGGEAV